ncbi:hypothetical protein FHS67_000401 [Aminobacter aminovorans]|jgi:hypothetical protein|uniref:Uncharacterized protein n=1 Tax=Aminobacter aminovorans TaxID=83263 RepID=A0AAC8YNC9_AMIAI|nr:hypothetical protein AA2016_2620 [Aminobacter aminovorans]MBB3704107.1 hypothetical protein [Aminobacter aminovorans]
MSAQEVFLDANRNKLRLVISGSKSSHRNLERFVGMWRAATSSLDMAGRRQHDCGCRPSAPAPQPMPVPVVGVVKKTNPSRTCRAHRSHPQRDAARQGVRLSAGTRTIRPRSIKPRRRSSVTRHRSNSSSRASPAATSSPTTAIWPRTGSTSAAARCDRRKQPLPYHVRPCGPPTQINAAVGMRNIGTRLGRSNQPLELACNEVPVHSLRA